ncbi:MAG: DUF1302 domain-containing protein [Gammaproteobacteria bacterium]|nr:DUF1302 domain-containing protein [Gammaproteobacteria bacterium]
MTLTLVGRSAPRSHWLLAAAISLALSAPALAEWKSEDGTLEVRGFLDDTTIARDDIGLTKQRVQGQLEFYKTLPAGGIFSSFAVGGTLRASYDAVFDLNDDEFGRRAGGSITYDAPGNPAFFSYITGGSPPFPDPPTRPVYAGIFGPESAGANGAIPLPGTLGTINSPSNPNQGLRLAAADIYSYQDGGVALATPVRPCDKDSRGCLENYMDKDTNDLRYKEFNDDWDWLREFYVDTTIPTTDSGQELSLRIGRQQVVWGRTDLFRVLDVVNPMDFSRENLYAEFEDSRIPQWMINAEYRIGPTKWLEDLNFQLIYKIEDFRPHDLGQGGEPYAILGAGNLFRALANCWDNGCTVGNFPGPGLVVDFPAHSIGIREVDQPDHTEIGGRIEGVWKGVGFSLNALYFYSQFPSLRGGIPTDDPFTPGVEATFHPYDIAFDVEFPRLFMMGGSADWYSEAAKASFRVETSYTQDEEFPDTSKPKLYSESDVFRAVFGFDRPTFVRFLNNDRAFLVSGQIFYQRLLDHETYNVNSVGLPTMNKIGFMDWESNVLLTLLIQGNYMNDRLTPQIITAFDTKAEAGVIGPSIEYKPSNNWVFKLALNLKWGSNHGAIPADDNRTANAFPPATCAPPLAMGGSPLCAAPYSSLGLSGFEPLGRFRSGPIGTAYNEDEVQFSLRYQF